MNVRSKTTQLKRCVRLALIAATTVCGVCLAIQCGTLQAQEPGRIEVPDLETRLYKVEEPSKPEMPAEESSNSLPTPSFSKEPEVDDQSPDLIAPIESAANREELPDSETSEDSLNRRIKIQSSIYKIESRTSR